MLILTLWVIGGCIATGVLLGENENEEKTSAHIYLVAFILSWFVIGVALGNILHKLNNMDKK